MFEEWVESACARHGLERHVRIHEAGHAVAAIDHGIPFRDVELFADSTGPKFEGGMRQAAAGVNMLSDDPADWVLPNRIDALKRIASLALRTTWRSLRHPLSSPMKRSSACSEPTMRPSPGV